MTNENTPETIEIPEKRTVITIFDGEEPGMSAMTIEHFPERDLGTAPGEGGIRLHMIVGTAIARLWDLQIVQRLTGSLCQDMIQAMKQQERQSDLTETDKSV